MSQPKIACRDPATKEQLEWKLEREPWREVAEFAAYHCQYQALNLKPWESPPCWVDEDDPDERDKAARALLSRMLTAGVSRYHPDPLAALGRNLGNDVRFRG